MLDARFSHLYFCHSFYTLQRGLPVIAGLLVFPRCTQLRSDLLNIALIDCSIDCYRLMVYRKDNGRLQKLLHVFNNINANRTQNKEKQNSQNLKVMLGTNIL